MPPFISRHCLLLLGFAAFGAAVLGLCFGTISIDPLQILRALAEQFGGDASLASTFESLAVIDLRLPRVILALLLGAALAQAGAAMQGLFRNPLADPGLVGVSSGSAVAAVSVIVFGSSLSLTLGIPLQWLLPLAAFGGGLCVALIVTKLAQIDGYTRVATLLLAGVALNAIAGAGVGFLSQIADDLALRNLTFWLFGSLGKASWTEILVVTPPLILTLVMLPRDAQALNALLLGEAEAQHLGIDVERMKRRVLVLIVLAVSSTVAVAGMIGFVGLVVPHLIRLWVGPDHRVLLPASALGGAALLCLADLAARLLLSPQELPIGILTALVGGPFFLILLLRHRNRPESW